MTVRELVTRLGFEADDKSVKKYDQALADVRRTALRASAAVGALATGVFLLTKQTAEYGDEVAKTSRAFGLNIRQLQQYRFAFERAGVSQDQVNTSLERLARNLGQAADGIGTGIRGFEALGINIRRTDGSLKQVSEIMPEIISQFSQVEGEAQGAAIASDLFGRSGIKLARALMMQDGEIENLMKQYDELGGGMSEAQALMSEKVVDALTNMRTATRGLRLEIGTKFYPVVEEIVNNITDWTIKNKEWIASGFSEAIEKSIRVIRAFLSLVKTLTSWINKITRGVFNWDKVIRILAVSVGTLIGLKVLAWIMAVVKGVGFLRLALISLQKVGILLLFTALVLIIEDLIVWINGGNSVLGKWIGTWEDFKKKIGEVADWVWIKMKEMYAHVKQKVLDIIDVFLGFWNPIVQGYKSAWDIIMGIFTLDKDRIMKGFDGIRDSLISWASHLVATVSGILKHLIPNWVLSAIDKGKNFIKDLTGGGGDSPAPGFPSPGLDVSPPDMSGDMARNSNRTISFNARTEAILQVPQGTPAEQKKSLEIQAEDIFKKHWDREIRKTLIDFQPID